MLEIRTVCENCGKELPNGSIEAMICSFECTFCHTCVSEVLRNVCPNCGGGFERRPTRPTHCVTENCLEKYPVSRNRKIIPVNDRKLKILQHFFEKTRPDLR